MRETITWVSLLRKLARLVLRRPETEGFVRASDARVLDARTVQVF